MSWFLHWPIQPFIYSFCTRSFIHSAMHNIPMHSFIHPLVYSFSHSVIHASIWPCSHSASCVCPFSHSSIHPSIYSCVHSSIHPLIQHSVHHPFIQSTIQTIKEQKSNQPCSGDLNGAPVAFKTFLPGLPFVRPPNRIELFPLRN